MRRTVGGNPPQNLLGSERDLTQETAPEDRKRLGDKQREDFEGLEDKCKERKRFGPWKQTKENAR